MAADWSAVRDQLNRAPDLFLIDADTWSADAIEVLSEVTRAGLRAALFTAHPSAELTLGSMARGALDVLPAPLTAERVRALLSSNHARPVAEAAPAPERWVGQSPALQAAHRAAADAARTHAHVLLVGERGAGKQLLARLIHEQSARAEQPFQVLHCAAMESALAAELFGQEAGPGALPVNAQLERVGAGAVYLDELESAAAGVQSRLADALSQGEYTPLGSVQRLTLKARVMAGLHADPRKEEARFRPELLQSFGVQIYVPPLRDRLEDIPLLASWFAGRFAAAHGKRVRGLAADVLAALEQYDWPSNVRELRSVMERAVVTASEEVLTLRDLPPEVVGRPQNMEVAELGDVTLATVERRHIRRIMQLTGGRLSETAQLLGIHRNTLRRKLEEYGINPVD